MAVYPTTLPTQEGARNGPPIENSETVACHGMFFPGRVMLKSACIM